MKKWIGDIANIIFLEITEEYYHWTKETRFNMLVYMSGKK